MSPSSQNDQGSSSSSKGKGRKKVDLKKIEDKNHLEVTFSKRKGGLLKKASELSTLSGVEVAAVVFSPSGKPYSFGNPNIYATTNKFIGQDVFPSTGRGQNSGAAQRHINVNQENLDQISQLESMLEAEKKFGKELDSDLTSHQVDFSKLDYDQLEMCLDIVQNFENDIGHAAQRGLNVDEKGCEPLQKVMFTSPPKANAPPPLAHRGNGSSSGLVVGPPPHGSNLRDPHDPSLGRSNFSVVPYSLSGHIGWNHSDVATGGTEVFTSPKADAMVFGKGSGSSFGFGGETLGHGSGSFSGFGGGPLAQGSGSSRGGPLTHGSGSSSGYGGEQLAYGSGSSSGFGGRPLVHGSGSSSGFWGGPLADPNDQWAGLSTVPYGSGGHMGWGMSSRSSGSNANGSGPLDTSGGGRDGSAASTSNHFKPLRFD